MSFRFPENDPSLLLILSGPAGCGKTTLSERLVANDPATQRIVTCTTRKPRPGEIDGVDYFFFSEEEFENRVKKGDFLEHAGVHENRYGTLRQEVEKRFSRSISVVLNIDVQGAASLRKIAGADPLLKGKMISIFVLPPNLEILRERLQLRGTEDPASIEGRLARAKAEMPEWINYDYCIRSGSKDEDFYQLQSILNAERRRVSRLKTGSDK